MTEWIKNWFSNMERLDNPIIVDGIEYPTVENFYAASKTLDIQQKRKIAALTPSVAKKYARTIPLRSDWEEVKFAIMLKQFKIQISNFKIIISRGKKARLTVDY